MNNQTKQPGVLSYASPNRRNGPRRVLWLAISFVALFILFMLFTMLMPSISSPRDQSPVARCASNLREIGQAILMYSNADSQGRFPSDLYTLMMAEELSPDCLVCPSTHDTRATQPGLKDLTAGGHLSYIYIGAGLTNQSPADAVVVYEPLSNHDNAGSNVLFADGHVEFIRVRWAAQLAAIAQSGIRPIYWPPHPATRP